LRPIPFAESAFFNGQNKSVEAVDQLRKLLDKSMKLLDKIVKAVDKSVPVASDARDQAEAVIPMGQNRG